MAASGFTPIQLYRTSTASAVPVNTNLADGELAINLLDERLYFKNSAGTVKLLAANITPVANGGTGTATPSLVQGTGVTITGSWPNQTINATGTGGTVTSVGGTGTVNGITLTGTVTSSGNLTLGGTLSGVNLTTQVTGTLPIANGGTGTTSTTFANLTTNVTGTLPVANGGTGRATLSNNALLVGNAASNVNFLAPGAAGNVVTSNGTTWASVAPTAGAGEFTFTSSGAITSGKAVILNPSGTVSQSAIAAQSVGSSVNFSGNNSTSVSTCNDPVNNKFVVFYRDTTDGNTGKAVVATVSGSTVTFGTPVVFFATALGQSSSNMIDSCYDSVTGQIIVFYAGSGNTGLLRAGTVSGTSITFGAELSIGEAANVLGVCYDTSISRVVINYSSGGSQKVRVISVSGTTLSLVSVAIGPGSSNGYSSSIVHCQGHSTPGTNIGCFNTGGIGYVYVITINPSTYAITIGSSQNPSAGDGYVFGTKALAWSSSFQRLYFLRDGGPTLNYGLVVNSISLSGTTLTSTVLEFVDTNSYGAPFEDFPSIACSPDGTSLCVAFVQNGSGDVGRFRFSTNLGPSTIGFGTNVQFDSSALIFTSVQYSADNLSALIGYSRGVSSGGSYTPGLGRGVVAVAPLLDKRTSFIGFAQSTVTSGQPVVVKTLAGVTAGQTGLTPGSAYYLSGSDGSTLTTTVTGPRVGEALTATQLLVLGTNLTQV